MNYLSSFFSSGQQSSSGRQLNEEQQNFIKHLKSSDGTFKIWQEADIEDMLCVQVTELEFSQIVKCKDGQTKKCIMINSSVSFRVQDIVEKDPTNGEDITLTIPCIAIENSEYDEDQGKFEIFVTKIVQINKNYNSFPFHQICFSSSIGTRRRERSLWFSSTQART